MLALHALNEHIRSKKLGKYLIPKRFDDGSTISPADGMGSTMVIDQNKPGGYSFLYNRNTRRLTDSTGAPLAQGVELETTRWDVDTTGVDVAKTGHTPAYKLALDALARRNALNKGSIINLVGRSEQELQVIESIRQRALAETTEKLTQAMSAASQSAPPEAGIDVLGPDSEYGPPGAIRRVPNVIDQTLPTDYSKIEKIGPEDLKWHREWKLPNQKALTVVPNVGEKAPLLVKSMAFQDMVNVKASRHAAVRADDLDSIQGGVGIVRYPIEQGGDGSEIHYRLDPDPIVGRPGTDGAGISIHKVLGFSVTVPHLAAEPGAEHTYRRDQETRAGTNDEGTPFGVVTRMTHQMARNDAQGNTHWSEPLGHEIGEAGEERYHDLTPRQEERIEVERSLGGTTLSDADFVLDEREHEIRTGYRRDAQGRPVEALGGMSKIAQSGSRSMRFLLHRQVAEHYGPIPDAMDRDDLVNLLTEARSRQSITDLTRIKADLIYTHGDDLHPENVRAGGQGFVINPELDQNSIRYQKYIDKHFRKILGMARAFKGDPTAPPERVGAAGDFLLDMFQKLPTVPKDYGGRNWLKVIRDDAMSKANPRPPRLGLVREREKAGRKQAEIIPHDTKIEQVHGVTLIGQHQAKRTRVPFTKELNEEDHPEVFAARTIGELHKAIHKIRTANPHTTDVRVQNRAKPKKIDIRAWRTGAAQPEPEEAPEIGALPHRSQVRVTLAGRDEITAINSTPEKGAPHTYRVDQAQKSRVATVAWSIYHPHSGSVVMNPNNSVAVFSSQSKAVAHAQSLQGQGAKSGHILVPLYKSSHKPIATPIHPDYIPREPGVNIPMIGRLAVPKWVQGKTVKEIPWGTAGEGLHAIAVRHIREERDASRRVALEALKTSMLSPSQLPIPEGHDSVLTRAPQNAEGRVPLRATFTPV